MPVPIMDYRDIVADDDQIFDIEEILKGTAPTAKTYGGELKEGSFVGIHCQVQYGKVKDNISFPITGVQVLY